MACEQSINLNCPAPPGADEQGRSLGLPSPKVNEARPGGAQRAL